MDAYEATKVVFSRIQNIDPENASKIMGLLLIQEHGEKEMIRLAFGPETLLHSLILKAKNELGLSSNSPPTPPSPNPFLRQNSTSRANLPPSLVIPSPSSLSSSPSSWAQTLTQDELIGAHSDPSLGSSLNSPSLPFFASESSNEFQLNSPTPDLLYPQPCLYFARGYCKNGTSCRFLHGGVGESAAAEVGALVGSPNKFDLADQCQELIRYEAAKQQRLAAASQLMGSPSFPYSPKGVNLLLQQQQNDNPRLATAFMLNDDMHKFGRFRFERNEIVNPASRQIYLTFPADSTFREEDVSNYFSIYGPVEDVRIPYQQKRMFGFVTFVYPETVKIILAKGNPHFVCDARVLVKPYKEKGKALDKLRKQQQVERGEFSPCGTVTGADSRDPFDLHLGSRMFYNARDALWRKKLEEQADLQQALELQSRRLMNLQLLDVKKQHHLRSFSTGSPLASPTQAPNIFSQNFVPPSFHGSPGVSEENGFISKTTIAVTSADQKSQQKGNMDVSKKGIEKSDHGIGMGTSLNEENEFQENVEHNLPESPFASPTKASAEFLTAFSTTMGVDNKDDSNKESVTGATHSSAVNGNLVTSSLDMASFKSFNCQIPRFSSGHGAIGMSGGNSGPTCPVGI